MGHLVLHVKGWSTVISVRCATGVGRHHEGAGRPRAEPRRSPARVRLGSGCHGCGAACPSLGGRSGPRRARGARRRAGRRVLPRGRPLMRWSCQRRLCRRGRSPYPGSRGSAARPPAGPHSGAGGRCRCGRVWAHPWCAVESRRLRTRPSDAEDVRRRRGHREAPAVQLTLESSQEALKSTMPGIGLRNVVASVGERDRSTQRSPCRPYRHGRDSGGLRNVVGGGLH
jgi:hypothetical protein